MSLEAVCETVESPRLFKVQSSSGSECHAAGLAIQIHALLLLLLLLCPQPR